MIQIKLLKDWKTKKAGEIINISKNGGDACVEAGVGEYLDTKITRAEAKKKVLEMAGEKEIKKEVSPEIPESEEEEKPELNEELISIMKLEPVKLNQNLKRIAKDYNCSVADLKDQIKFLKKEYAKERSSEKEEITFDYEFKDSDVKTIEELKKVIVKNFPSIWFETKACLAACATISLKNLNGCPSLNLIGSPSGEKTTALSFFYGQDKTYLSDDFTPRSFVSMSANVPKEDLGEVDLLPKIKNKILLTPELAPVFEAPKDKLIDNFATLTRVLDGEGLNRDAGTHGHRGYTGDFKFAWIGASTPLKASVWNVMGKIGNRLFFLNMREKNRNDADYLEMFRGRAYEEKVKECRGAVRSFLDNLYKQNGSREILWDAEGDILLLPEIIKYAKFLSKLRGSLMTWKGEEKGTYEYSFPIIEEPPRAINSLYNLAKGHALINGRTFLKKEDLEIVRAVCFSSMPHDRSEFLKLLAKHEGKLTTGQIEKELNCSQDTALRTMKIFEILGVVKIKRIDIETYSGVGRPMNYIEINQEFEEVLEYTQVLNDAINHKPHENRGVSDAYNSINPEDFVKNKAKKELSQVGNGEINSLSQENNAVLGQKGDLTQVFSGEINFSDSGIKEQLEGSQNE
jgi:hypothetical protein